MSDGTQREARPFRPGLPFVIRDLIKQRARQREELRLVEHDILLRAVEDIGEPPDVPTDRALIESELRRYADSLREQGDLPGYLTQMAEITRAEALGRWGDTTSQARGGHAEHAAQQFHQNWQGLQQRDKLHPPSLGVADAEALLEYVVTLVLADELADDGYRDPRLPG